MKPPNISWLTVDPGLNGTGYAWWQYTKLQQCGILRTRVKGDVTARALDLASQLTSIATSFNCVCVACEWPAFHGGVAGEMVARRGDLVKLTYLVGVFAGMLYRPFIPVEISAWKGNLPKRVVEQRVEQILGSGTMELLRIRSHSVDAVGIGLYLLGEL